MNSDHTKQLIEQIRWAAHQRAAHLRDQEPGLVSHEIFNAVAERWRESFMRLR